MATHSVITLSNTTASRITPSGTHSGLDITIQNIDASAYVYIGGLETTLSNFGFRLAPGNAISFELPGKDFLYAISDTNESKVAVLKTNLEIGS
jgi:hypothetical protein